MMNQRGIARQEHISIAVTMATTSYAQDMVHIKYAVEGRITYHQHQKPE